MLSVIHLEVGVPHYETEEYELPEVVLEGGRKRQKQLPLAAVVSLGGKVAR